MISKNVYVKGIQSVLAEADFNPEQASTLAELLSEQIISESGQNVIPSNSVNGVSLPLIEKVIKSEMVSKSEFEKLKEVIATKSDLEKLKEVMATKSDLEVIKLDLGNVKSEVGSLKSEVGSLKSGMNDFKLGLESLKSDLIGLKSEVVTGYSQLDSRISNVEKNIASLKWFIMLAVGLVGVGVTLLQVFLLY